MLSDIDKSKIRIGFKQTMRSLSENEAQTIYLAEDCENKIKDPINKAAAESGIQIIYVPTMKELGSMCGIEVKASCAVLLK